MSFLKEFREFAMRGNVVDLAVGVIIGAAFGKIVSSLVADIIMPPLGLLIGGIDFKQFAVTLRDAQGDVPAVVMHYGVFILNQHRKQKASGKKAIRLLATGLPVNPSCMFIFTLIASFPFLVFLYTLPE